MYNNGRSRISLSRRVVLGTGISFLLIAVGARANSIDSQELNERFDYLSANANSNCSMEFMESIATMPAAARLQGSCCSPMNRHRYPEQVEALANFHAIEEIPPDPYDIAAGLAQKLMPYYDLLLNAEEQQIYQFSMDNSDERGPCCWRWKLYGGLAKYLIREHQFSGGQLVEVWNLSNGCGGDSR
jgi:hypothetical protein